MLGKIEDGGRRGWQKMRSLDSITDSMHMNLSKVLDTVGDIGACCAIVNGTQIVGHDLATEQQLYLHI